ncbi:MAG TPA: hypothetical protein VJ302_30560 [Blastocatellia bacterium]|nr:hypothetical protein [Blastocatellia bacterium]
MADVVVGFVKHKHITTEYKPSGAAPSPPGSGSHQTWRMMNGIAIGIVAGLFLQHRYPIIQDRFASYVDLSPAVISSLSDYILDLISLALEYF